MHRLDFNSSEFLGLTLEERIGRCRAMAAESQSLAASGIGEVRDAYLNLAAKWTDLADEMQRGTHQTDDSERPTAFELEVASYSNSPGATS